MRKIHRPERLLRDGLNQNVQNPNRAAKPTPSDALTPNSIFEAKNHRPEPLGRDGLQKDVGAAGGRGVIPPYPAANELSGIYVTESARGVDTREVKSRFDNSRPLVPTLRLSLEPILFKPA